MHYGSGIYAAPVWDPYLNKNIQAIEMVQRCAACWMTSDYDWNSSVTSMLCNLQWPNLSHHCKISRLKTFTMLYIIIFLFSRFPNTSPLPPMLHATTTHFVSFFRPQELTHIYKFSFFPRTIHDWNNLPIGSTSIQ